MNKSKKGYLYILILCSIMGLVFVIAFIKKKYDTNKNLVGEYKEEVLAEDDSTVENSGIDYNIEDFTDPPQEIQVKADISIENESANIINLKDTESEENEEEFEIQDSIEAESLISTGRIIDAYVTYYGWTESSGYGNSIAYPNFRYSEAIHNHASGKGTYEDPITFASNPSMIDIGTIVYVPYIKKYIVMEDRCGNCINNWENNDEIHIDIWMTGSDKYKNELLRCQLRLTRPSIEVEIDPPDNREVIDRSLFNGKNGECYL